MTLFDFVFHLHHEEEERCQRLLFILWPALVSLALAKAARFRPLRQGCLTQHPRLFRFLFELDTPSTILTRQEILLLADILTLLLLLLRGELL